MFRFFVKTKVDNYFLATQDTYQHLKAARVLKKPFLCIYEGVFYRTKLHYDAATGRVAQTKDGQYLIAIIAPFAPQQVAPQQLILAAAIIKFKRFEWLIEKAAELGATQIIPLVTQNTLPHLAQAAVQKQVRWNKIAQMASQQAFRPDIMKVSNVTQFAEVLNYPLAHKYIAHEKATSQQITTFPTATIFLVGPEGGFTTQEVALATQQQWTVVNLGQRILRAETASLVCLANTKQDTNQK